MPIDQLSSAQSWKFEVNTLAQRAKTMLDAGKINYSELKKINDELTKKINNAADIIRSKTEKCSAKQLRPFIESVEEDIKPTLDRSKKELQQHPRELKIHSRWERLGFA